ncbi:MAG: N-acetylmuramoyl-L-alanine amidase, partial [bacterium]|nr:N-acetylmuramoyl-L-alanine amidase [bacterium]
LLSLSVSIRSYDHPGYTRLVFEGDRGFEFNVDQSKNTLDLKLNEKAQLEKEVISFNRSALVDKVVHRVERNKSVLKVQLKSPYKLQRNFVLERPFRVVFDLKKSGTEGADAVKIETPVIQPVPEKKEPPQEQEEDPVKTQDAGEEDREPPKRRASIEVICLDPGHGGSDLGAVGKSKTAEKDITIKIAKKLKQLIRSRLGLNVVMTRDKDTEVSLNSRVSIANNRKAQVFVSIHVNSSYRKSARGSETYFVSLKATDQEAFQLSQKENKVFEELNGVTEDDELKMILWDMAQNEYIKESSRLAEFMQDELNILLHTRNRGVKQAPFRVLMRAAMPAVLVEVAFLSNAYEEGKLQDDAFLDNVADALYTGISKYIHYHNSTFGRVSRVESNTNE